MSYNGIGLSTARGSGTNGYVVKNKSTLRYRHNDFKPAEPYTKDVRMRKPNPELVAYERKRAIEVKCLTLQDQLEEDGIDEEEIDKQVDALRKKLTAEGEAVAARATAAASLVATSDVNKEWNTIRKDHHRREGGEGKRGDSYRPSNRDDRDNDRSRDSRDSKRPGSKNGRHGAEDDDEEEGQVDDNPKERKVDPRKLDRW